MYSFYREIHPPTGVDHCVKCNFYSHGEKNLVTACSSYLRVYRLTEAVGSTDSSTTVSGSSSHCKLQEVGEYQLYGNVESMDSVELVDSYRDALLLAFSSAKLSIIEYDPATESLQTISLHCFEEDELRDGMRFTEYRPIVRTDPEGRCATMLIYGNKLAVLPFRHDSLLDDHDLESPQLAHHDRSAVLPSSVINLKELTTPIIHVKDYQFLHGYHNPTILFLCEHQPTWAGRVPVRKDTCGIVAVSINMSGQQYPVIWTMTNLPYDCFKAMAVPKPLGGALVFAVNSLHYLNQSYPSVDVSLNSITDATTNLPLKKQPGVVLTLDSCNALFLSHDQLLLSLKGGEIYVVTLVIDTVAVRGIKSFNFTKTAAGVITSCMCPLSSQYLFFGSRLGNSLLLKYILKRQLQDMSAPQPSLKRIKSEEWMGTDDGDDLEMYGSETVTTSSSQHTSYSFEVCDSVVNIGPIANVALGEPGFVSEEFTDRGECDLQLVACSGHGKNGAITVLQRSVRPHIVTTFELPGCTDMWTVFSSEQEESVDLNTVQDIDAHAFLILSHKDSTMVLQTGQEITELDSSGFVTSSPTVFAGNIGEKKYILQVTSSTVQLLQGVERVHQITLDGNHGAVVSCDVAGLYGVLLLQEGVGLLRLHEGQGEQLMEAGMSMDDEQSFSANDGGQILTLDWPKLDQQASKVVCISVYKDTSGIFSLDAMDPDSFFPRRRKSSEKLPLLTTTPDKSLIDEEDELLYGDDSMMVKKEEIKSPMAHIPSTPLHSRHSTRSPVTYWCALAREDGSMEIYSLPEFILVYSVRNFSSAPHVLVDSGPIHSSSHQITSSEYCVKELLLTALGPHHSYPHLLALIDNDLVIYKAYQYPLSSVQGHLQLRFSKHNHRILLRDKKDSKIVKSTDIMSDETTKDGVTVHVPQLRVFRDVAGYCGVFVCGAYPHWLFMSERGALRCHPMNIDGPVVTFSSFHNVNCKKGFLYFNNEGELRISVLPTYLSYDSHWPVRKVPTKATPHFVSYHPEAKVHAVIVSEDKVSKVIPKMSTTGDEAITVDSVERDERFVYPTIEMYSLQLYSPTVWEPVPNSKHEFEEFEQVVTMKVMNLRSQETVTGRKSFIVIGSSTAHGEELISRGKITIYDIIEVVPEPGKPLTKHKLKLLCSKEQKGPVTALEDVDGYLLSCIGQKIYMWNFRDNKDIIGCAFIDSKLYIHSATSIRNFILIADVLQSVTLLQHREDLKTLSIISKDPFAGGVYATDYVVDGQQLGFIVTDAQGNIVIYQYQPEVPESNGGKKLVQRCDINAGTRINTLFRIKCKPSVSPMLSREIRMAVTERRQATYYASLDGGIGYIIPLPEKTYRRFSMLQSKLVTGLPHAAGLNPKGFRMFHPSRSSPLVYPQRNMLDGELLWRYPLLSNKERFDFAKQIGTTQNQILDDLMDIERNTAHL